MTAYTTFVTAHPFIAAAIQFGILGTLGEVISCSLVNRKFALPCNFLQLMAKVLGWAVLGIIIKYGFAGMKGFSHALIDHGLLPSALNSTLGFAVTVSVFTNILFGPQMMAFHRLTDNLILKTKGFQGIQRAWWTLIWFWIPAHTLTFSLPREYQIGLAAVWSVVLGIIMGFSNKKK